MRPHHNLQVWKSSIEITKRIYEVTGSFPSDEKFGLVSQMRRSAVSIASNIGEGAGRNNKKEFNQFLGIAQGSCVELETQVIISRELDFLHDQSAKELIESLESISKMIAGLRKNISSQK
jgi:four helix bundle protein